MNIPISPSKSQNQTELHTKSMKKTKNDKLALLEQGFQEMLLAHWTTTWIYPYWSTFPRLWCGAEIAEKIFRKTDTRKKIESNLSNSELNYCVKGERMYASKQTKDISRFVQCFISIFGVTVNMVFITILLFACSFQYIYYYYHLQLSDAIFILWASPMKSIVVQPASRHTLLNNCAVCT